MFVAPYCPEPFAADALVAPEPFAAAFEPLAAWIEPDREPAPDAGELDVAAPAWIDPEFAAAPDGLPLEVSELLGFTLEAVWFEPELTGVEGAPCALVGDAGRA